jgi:hypothetical protein
MEDSSEHNHQIQDRKGLWIKGKIQQWEVS